MAKRKQFDDPLEDIDPVMQDAFDSTEETPLVPETKSKKPSKKTVSKPSKKVSGPQTLQPPPEPDFPDDEDDDEIIADFPDLEESDQPGFGPAVSDIQFPPLNQEAVGKKIEIDLFSNIPVNLSVELGRSQISLKEVFELTEGSIIELERLVGEPLDLVVNGQIIAQGEVVAIDNNYGLRVTSIISNS